ncbi:hypothetical protein HHI36_018767 [Cryptolaemus montrouzieri]|uniref:Uncharacterized protein n=1 Tax=Cryptolaemus montrouzieri TaxID=559131 RepID=A0ABD2P0W8_9CUCU
MKILIGTEAAEWGSQISNQDREDPRDLRRHTSKTIPSKEVPRKSGDQISFRYFIPKAVGIKGLIVDSVSTINQQTKADRSQRTSEKEKVVRESQLK